MRYAKRIRNTMFGGALTLLAACSSAGGGGAGETPDASGGAAGSVAIQVTNDLVPPSTVTVWIVPETGSRRRLGTVSPNGQQTFNFNPNLRSMEHRLVAEASGREDNSSNPFVFEGVQSVQWSVSTVVIRTNR